MNRDPYVVVGDVVCAVLMLAAAAAFFTAVYFSAVEVFQ